MFQTLKDFSVALNRKMWSRSYLDGPEYSKIICFKDYNQQSGFLSISTVTFSRVYIFTSVLSVSLYFSVSSKIFVVVLFRFCFCHMFY